MAANSFLMDGLRVAQFADAAALARLAERTFRSTFGDYNSAASMDLHCAGAFGPGVQAREILDPNMRTLLAEHAGMLAGFGQLRLAQEPPACAPGAAVEIRRLYVDHGWQGTGVARTLMAALLELAAQAGAASVWLGVWDRNARARAFYEKFAFRVVGDHPFDFGGDAQSDLVMVKDLKP